MKILTTRFVAVGVVVFGMAGRGVSVWGADMHVVMPGAAAAAMPGAGPNLQGYPYVPMMGRAGIDPKIVATVKNPHLDDGIFVGGPPVVAGAVVPEGSSWEGPVVPQVAHPEIFHPGPTVQVTPIVPPAHPEIFHPRPNAYMAPLLPPRKVQATQPGQGNLKK